MLTRSFSLSLEGMNGSMGELARDVLTQMGCEVSGINLEADGHFPQGAPDPSRPDRLAAGLWKASGRRLTPQADPALLDPEDDGDLAYWRRFQ